MSPNPAHARLRSIQCLRALAASGVVFLHAHMTAERFSAGTPVVSSVIADFGNYGVDLFFVISGFVIYYTNYPTPQSAGRFFLRRAHRIVPLYALLTLLAFGLRRALPGSSFVSPVPGLADLVLSVTFLSGHQPIIGVGWTLEFEMFFYTCSALALALLGGRWSRVAYVLVALAVGGRFMPIEAGPLAVLMDPLLFEFVYGLVVAEAYCTGRWPVPKLAAIAIGLVALGRPGDAVIWVGIPAAFLVYGAARLSGRMPSSFATRLCCALGDASYSIYLIQFFTLPLIGRVARSVLPGDVPNLLLVTGFAGTLAAGYGCYVALERPMQRRSRRWLARPDG